MFALSPHGHKHANALTPHCRIRCHGAATAGGGRRRQPARRSRL